MGHLSLRSYSIFRLGNPHDPAVPGCRYNLVRRSMPCRGVCAPRSLRRRSCHRAVASRSITSQSAWMVASVRELPPARPLLEIAIPPADGWTPVRSACTKSCGTQHASPEARSSVSTQGRLRSGLSASSEPADGVARLDHAFGTGMEQGSQHVLRVVQFGRLDQRGGRCGGEIQPFPLRHRDRACVRAGSPRRQAKPIRSNPVMSASREMPQRGMLVDIRRNVSSISAMRCVPRRWRLYPGPSAAIASTSVLLMLQASPESCMHAAAYAVANRTEGPNPVLVNRAVQAWKS